MKRINYGFYILVLVAFTVSFTLVLLLYRLSPFFNTETLFFCQQYVSHVMFEIPRSLPNVFTIITGAVLMLGLSSFLLRVVKTHILLKKLLLKKVAPGKDLFKVTSRLGLSGKVVSVSDTNLFSFCVGFISPRIIISTALVKSLNSKELEAVLLHEQSHLLRRDPIKVLIGKTFALMFFFLPLFSELNRNIEAANEVLADQWTINYQQEAAFLRRALRKILATPQLNLAAVSSASGPDYFEIRIHRLMTPGVKYRSGFSFVSLATTLLFIVLSWFLLLTPADAFHMGAMGSSDFSGSSKSENFLCSTNYPCSGQCHSGIDRRQSHVPATFTPQPKCDNNPNSPSFRY